MLGLNGHPRASIEDLSTFLNSCLQGASELRSSCIFSTNGRSSLLDWYRFPVINASESVTKSPKLARFPGLNCVSSTELNFACKVLIVSLCSLIVIPHWYKRSSKSRISESFRLIDRSRRCLKARWWARFCSLLFCGRCRYGYSHNKCVTRPIFQCWLYSKVYKLGGQILSIPRRTCVMLRFQGLSLSSRGQCTCDEVVAWLKTWDQSLNQLVKSRCIFWDMLLLSVGSWWWWWLLLLLNPM